MALRVLSWNLLHGRADPPAGRYLLEDFSRALAGWSWDVALLQEVPPWWPAELGERLGASSRRVLTSRNSMLALRRVLAIRWPDVIKSNGGGANAILVRSEEIVEHRTLRLRTLPERRRLQAVRLNSGLWVGNLHATVRDDAAARAEAALAARTLLAWAEDQPAVLGGDFNVRGLTLAGFELTAVCDVDMVFARGLGTLAPVQMPDRGQLSDHAPLVAMLER